MNKKTHQKIDATFSITFIITGIIYCIATEINPKALFAMISFWIFAAMWVIGFLWTCVKKPKE